MIKNSAHYIQIEAPEAVITAVRDVVEAVRENKPISFEESVPKETKRVEEQ